MFFPRLSTRGERKRRGAFVARDPRFLIASFAAIVVSAFVVPGSWGLAVVASYLVLLHRLCGLSRSSLVGAARAAGPFVIIVVAVNAVLVPGEPLIASLRFVSREGVSSGIHAGARVCVLCLAAVVFLGVLSAEDVARGVSSLVRPVSRTLARRVAMYGFISFGFLPLFLDELQRIVTAQRFRGAGLHRGFGGKLGSARLLVVPLVISAIRRSEQLAMSVELRRIRERIGCILVLEQPSEKDYLYLAVTLIVLAAAGSIP